MRGGYGTSDHGSLADRHAAATAPAVPSSPARHCHVDGQPSLLLEWRRAVGGWEGRVVSLVWLDAVGWASVERWLPAADIVAAAPG
jgi:hypothetical protein